MCYTIEITPQEETLVWYRQFSSANNAEGVDTTEGFSTMGYDVR